MNKSFEIYAYTEMFQIFALIKFAFSTIKYKSIDMTESSSVITSAMEKIDYTVSHTSAASASMGEITHQKNNDPAEKQAAQQTPPAQQHAVEGQRENLLHAEDLGFLAMQKDPRYIFYHHPIK